MIGLIVAVPLLYGCGHAAKFTVVADPVLDYYERPNAGNFQIVSVSSTSRSGNAVVPLVETALRNEAMAARSIDPEIQLVTSNGGTLISARVLEWTLDIGDEQCTINVDGNQRTFNQRAVRDNADGRLVIEFIVTDPSGSVLFTQDYLHTVDEQSTGRLSNESRCNNPPDPLTPQGILAESVPFVVSIFAPAIFPYTFEVRERFDQCDGHDACDAVVDLAREGDLQTADEMLSDALIVYEDAGINDDNTRAVAGLLRNRAIVRRYSGDRHGALEDLERAIQLSPNENAWRTDINEIQAELNDSY